MKITSEAHHITGHFDWTTCSSNETMKSSRSSYRRQSQRREEAAEGDSDEWWPSIKVNNNRSWPITSTIYEVYLKFAYVYTRFLSTDTSFTARAAVLAYRWIL